MTRDETDAESSGIHSRSSPHRIDRSKFGLGGHLILQPWTLNLNLKLEAGSLKLMLKPGLRCGRDRRRYEMD